jgi:type IV pilus assembly protein PilB
MPEEILNPLLSLVREQGLVDDLQYEDVAAEIKRSNASAVQVLQDFGIMKLDDILHVEANYLGTEVVSLKDREFSPELLTIVPAGVARMYRCLPVALNGDTLQVALAEPLDPARADEIHFAAKRDVQIVVADPAEIDRTIDRLYGAGESESFAEILKELGKGKDMAREVTEAADDEKLMADLANDNALVRFVNMVLQQAVSDRASDIHFEPFETEFRIRYRVDGALYEMAPPPKHLALPVISRLKIMANLNISERRMPQDGRITHNVLGKQVDLRMATLPTQFGESVVLRVLDRSSVTLELESLGLPKAVYDFVSEVILRPNGIFVVTGPTGCGKTTTLYSCLRRVNTIDSKLLTAEDPVEFDIEGIMQVAIHEAVGLTFSKALRSFLRQDPDVIMVGEIRDLETAEIAIKAAQTGHLVLSTLHTNDAPQTLTRLVDMGVKPYAIATSVSLIIAQRLARKLCNNCKQPIDIPGEALRKEGFEAADIDSGFKVFRAVGCGQCTDGYKGRVGIYQVMPVTETIGRIIMEGGGAININDQATKDGVWNLRRSGLQKVKDGVTSLEEVNNVTID